MFIFETPGKSACPPCDINFPRVHEVSLYFDVIESNGLSAAKSAGMWVGSTRALRVLGGRLPPARQRRATTSGFGGRGAKLWYH